MRLFRLSGAVCTLAICLPLVAAAQDAPPPVPPTVPAITPSTAPSFQFGATLWYDYTMTLEPKSKDADGNTISSNAFNVTRTYLNFTGQVSDLISFRVTPDITRDGDPGSTLSGNLVFRVKYAFASVNLSKWTGKWRDTWVRGGIQQTPYVAYTEDIYRYRFQGPMLVERETFEGAPLLTSSDAGVSFHTTFPGNWGEFHTGVYNGEGYAKTEANNQKAFQVRTTFRPLAYSTSQIGGRSLSVTMFYDADHYQQSAARRRLTLSLTAEHRRLNAGFEFLDATDQPSAFRSEIESRGWSFWVTPFVKERGNGLEGLLRVDQFTPNTTLSSQTKQRLIGGVAYWFPHPGGPATAALLVDFEQLTFEKFPATPANAKQQRIAVHGLINF